MDVPVTFENFYAHFRQLSNVTYGDAGFDYAGANEEVSHILNDPITSQEIMKSICRLKNNKSSGGDHIVNEYIKSTKEIFCPLYF